MERSAYAIDLVSAFQQRKAGTEQATKVKPRGRKRKTSTESKASKQYAEDHGVSRGSSLKADEVPHGAQPPFDPDALDEGLLLFVQSTTCRRCVWTEAFEGLAPCESQYKSSHERQLTPVLYAAPIGPCCDICSPELLDRTRPCPMQKPATAKRISRGLPDVHAMRDLLIWREEVYDRDHSGMQYDSTAILDDGTIEHLASVGPMSSMKLAKILQPTWIWWDKYREELLTRMTALNIVYIAKTKKKVSPLPI